MFSFNVGFRKALTLLSLATAVLCVGTAAHAQSVTAGNATGTWSYSMSVGDIYGTSANVSVPSGSFSPQVGFNGTDPYYTNTNPSDTGTFSISTGLNFYTSVYADAGAVGTESYSAGAVASLSGSVTWTVTGTPNSIVKVTYTCNPSTIVTSAVNGTGSATAGGGAEVDNEGWDISPVPIEGPLNSWTPGEQQVPVTKYNDVYLDSSGNGTMVLSFRANASASVSANNGSAGSTSQAGAGIVFEGAEYYLP